MNQIAPNTTLTARSICDYETIFRVLVIARKGQFVTVKVHGNEKRVKIHKDDRGKHSMAPVFRA